jgi:hypothetical protein
MDYEALAQAKLNDFIRERRQLHLVAHARRLNPSSPRTGVSARFDRVLIRIGHGAAKRQARRAASRGGDLPVRGVYR